jgi:hypothetical protein
MSVLWNNNNSQSPWPLCWLRCQQTQHEWVNKKPFHDIKIWEWPANWANFKRKIHVQWTCFWSWSIDYRWMIDRSSSPEHFALNVV